VNSRQLWPIWYNIRGVIIRYNPKVSICSFQNTCQALGNDSFNIITSNDKACKSIEVVSSACSKNDTTPKIISDGTQIKMKDWILFPDDSSIYEVKNNSSVAFKAGERIDIEAGFKVEAGAT